MPEIASVNLTNISNASSAASHYYNLAYMTIGKACDRVGLGP